MTSCRRLGPQILIAFLALFGSRVLYGQPCGLCTPSDIQENEPNCGRPTDTTNGGCTIPPAFTTIGCNQTVCATSFFDPAAFQFDSDIYEFTLTQSTLVTFTITAEFAAQAALLAGHCPDLMPIDQNLAGACVPFSVSACMPAGVFHLQVIPQLDPSFNVPCGSRYRVSMSCTPCTLAPNLTCESAQVVDVPSSTSATTTDGFFNFDAPQCFGQSTARGLWYSVTGTGHTLTATTCNETTDFDTALTVYCGACDALFCVAGNDNDSHCTQSPSRSTVSWCSSPGQSYFILVHGFSDQTGHFALDISQTGRSCSDPIPCATCTDPCPAGAQQEVEANCGLNQIGQPDTSVNGGCANNPPSFTAIACNIPVCGTAAFNGVFRDEDWYELVTTENATITWTVTADFEAEAAIVVPAPDCPSFFPVVDEVAPRCQAFSVSTPCVGPGRYYFLVAPRFTNAIPCGRRYTAVATCTPCSFCPIDCAGGRPEGEQGCGLPQDTTNGGCNSLPPVYGATHCGERICGTSGFDGRTTDTDWYEFVVTERTRVVWSATAQFDINLLIVQLLPDCDNFAILAAAEATQCNTASLAACLDPGTYYLFIKAGLEQIPFTTCREYAADVGCGPCPPCDVSCGPAAIQENEPDCGLPVDTVNGGCNSDPPVFIALACGQEICATSGASPFLGRDTDWYEVVLNEATTITWTVTADFDSLIGVVDTGGVPNCTPGLTLNPGRLGSACQPVSVSACLAPGTWWLFVAPANFNPLPCGARYSATLTCGCRCPGDVDMNGQIDADDIQQFIACYVGGAEPCSTCASCADMDHNGALDPADIVAFTQALLSNTACP